MSKPNALERGQTVFKSDTLSLLLPFGHQLGTHGDPVVRPTSWATTVGVNWEESELVTTM